MRLRLKYVLFAFIGAMIAYVLFHNEIFLVQPANPHWQHYQALGLWLLVHGVAGGSALILAPMQFSDRLRMRFTKLHRVSGRIYVTGALILGPFGIYIQYMDERMGLGPRSFTVETVIQASLLVITTAIGFGACSGCSRARYSTMFLKLDVSAARSTRATVGRIIDRSYNW